MADVKFKRILNSSQINTIPFSDGNFIITKDGKQYIDYDSDRVLFGIATDTAMDDDSTNAVENRIIKQYVDNLYRKLAGTIVWTNSSPTSTFGAQTINLSKKFSDGYDSYEILFRQNNNASNTRLLSTGVIPKGHGTILTYNTSAGTFRATGVTMGDQSITFEDAQPSNEVCIPMYVILYDKGLYE